MKSAKSGSRVLWGVLGKGERRVGGGGGVLGDYVGVAGVEGCHFWVVRMVGGWREMRLGMGWDEVVGLG